MFIAAICMAWKVLTMVVMPYAVGTIHAFIPGVIVIGLIIFGLLIALETMNIHVRMNVGTLLMTVVTMAIVTIFKGIWWVLRHAWLYMVATFIELRNWLINRGMNRVVATIVAVLAIVLVI